MLIQDQARANSSRFGGAGPQHRPCGRVAGVMVAARAARGGERARMGGQTPRQKSQERQDRDRSHVAHVCETRRRLQHPRSRCTLSRQFIRKVSLHEMQHEAPAPCFINPAHIVSPHRSDDDLRSMCRGVERRETSMDVEMVLLRVVDDAQEGWNCMPFAEFLERVNLASWTRGQELVGMVLPQGPQGRPH